MIYKVVHYGSVYLVDAKGQKQAEKYVRDLIVGELSVSKATDEDIEWHNKYNGKIHKVER